MAMGAVMVLVAVAMTADLDTRFQTAIADDLPSFLVNPTGEIEENEAIASDLDSVSPHGGGGAEEAGAPELDEGIPLPELGLAPDFTGTQSWFNTPENSALQMDQLRGQVVLIDFWTYTCINCIRTFPHLKAWDDALPRRRPDDRRGTRPRVPVRERRRQRLRRDRPERDRVPRRPGQRHGHLERLRQPVLAGQVPDRRQRAGPLRPLRRGRIRRDRVARSARCSARRATRTWAATPRRCRARRPTAATRTPETYLGALRAEGWTNGADPAGQAGFRRGTRRPVRERVRVLGRVAHHR